MCAVRLTDAAVRKYRADPKQRREISDTRSPLRLVIQTSGVKSWCMRLRRPGGASAKLTLGRVYDPAKNEEPADAPVLGGIMTLAQARELAASVQRERARGTDVAAQVRNEKRERRQATVAASEVMFEAVARRYIERHARPNVRRWRDVAFTLGLDPDGDKLPIIAGSIADRWRGRTAASITKADVVQEIDRAVDRAPTAGNRVKAALSQVFRWHGRRVDNANIPTAMVEMPVPLKKLRRSRRLTDDEIRWLWRALDECAKADEIPEAYAALLRFTLLTAVRRDEARELVEKEITGKNWIVPGERTKNHLDHLVPLSAQAREELRKVPRIEGTAFVFTLGNTPLGNLSRYKNKLHARMEKLAGATVPQWQMHDFRRNVRSYLSQVVSPDIAERVLGHVKEGLRQHYDLHEYENEKRTALEAWAREVERIVSGGKPAKVLPLRKPARR